MWKPSRRIVIAFFITAVSGAALHFLFTLLPSIPTALFSPVQESVWEHVKIIYWPFLVSSLLLTRGGSKSCRTPWALSLLIICALMLLAGYIYNITFYGDNMAVNIVIYTVAMAVGFLLPSLLWRSAASKWSSAVFFAVIVLGVAILLFTFIPPEGVLFDDLSSAGAWSVIPY